MPLKKSLTARSTSPAFTDPASTLAGGGFAALVGALLDGADYHADAGVSRGGGGSGGGVFGGGPGGPGRGCGGVPGRAGFARRVGAAVGEGVQGPEGDQP